ncbi:hypothetical protein BgiMline_017606 [Biomphalaria glabrata]|nr:putative G-protein coupled receptor [Biomphalaria glabrata]
MTISSRTFDLAAGACVAASCIFTVVMAVSTSIVANQDDYYTDTNFTVFTYHLPEDEDINSTLEWFLGFTDMPPNGDAYNSYDVIGEGGGGDKSGDVTGGGGGDLGTKVKPLLPSSKNIHENDEKDIVELFLAQVESYDQNKAKCTPGTEHNLGSGVIKQYGLNRFKAQALVTVNRANLLTRIWKEADNGAVFSEYLFYTQVRSIVEGDPEIFAAGNCYDKYEFRDYYLFCPYSYRMEDGRINVKDLSLEYDYLGNTSMWFYSARMKAKHLENFNMTKGKIDL